MVHVIFAVRKLSWKELTSTILSIANAVVARIRMDRSNILS